MLISIIMNIEELSILEKKCTSFKEIPNAVKGNNKENTDDDS